MIFWITRIFILAMGLFIGWMQTHSWQGTLTGFAFAFTFVSVELVITLKASRYSYYKLIAKPVNKLPAWHSAKGKKGWVFVDEVFFY